MGIKRAQHAIDRAADQHVVFDRLDIIGLDLLICRKQLRKLRARPAINLRHSGGGRRDKRHGCDKGGAAQQISDSHVWLCSNIWPSFIAHAR